jgi:Gpi18-like mannosyltransferase
MGKEFTRYGQSVALKIRMEPWATILTEFIVTRCALVVLALGALILLPSVSGPEYHHVSSNPLIDMWSRWDAAYYTQIAQQGYGWQMGQPTSDTTFMPLYPVLLGIPFRFQPGATRADVIVAGVILSNLCLLLAVFCFDALVALDFADPQLRQDARWLIWLAPMSIFFSGVYTESLYLLLSLVSIYYARRGQWAIAGLAGFLGGLTRVVGWTLVLPLAWEAWRQRQHSVPPRLTRLTAVVAPALALPMYAAIVGYALADPLAYFSIGATWQRSLSFPWQAFARYFDGPIVLLGWERSITDLLFTLVFLLLAVLSYRLRPSYGMYAVAVVVVSVMAGNMISMPRYVAVAFPVYLLLAQWAQAHRWRRFLLFTLSALLAVLATSRFVTWHWIA